MLCPSSSFAHRMALIQAAWLISTFLLPFQRTSKELGMFLKACVCVCVFLIKNS